MPARYRSDSPPGTAGATPRSSLVAVSRGANHPRSRRRAGRALLVVLMVCASASIVTACGTSGRALREPAPGATAPPRKATTTTAPNTFSIDPDDAVIRPTGFSLTSTAWSDGGAIPAQFGCAGADTSPPLTIGGVPDGTVELLLVATDTASPSSPRWIVADIAPSTIAFDQGSTPSGSVEVVNSTGSTRWAGPCPDPGTSTTFQLRLYALSAPSGLSAGSGPDAIRPAITTATQAAVLRGSASREISAPR